ncbi:MAG TPA: LPS export ABC transporter permease LptF [Rhizomicrobium sp.]|jgi:lipopolysaccharide export system permease protein|nr:LPS export ABC transporter permease LptF [Rhizomicrobium sp.]
MTKRLLPRLSFYILGQLLGPVALLTFLMTSVIWLITCLPLLDLVINRGQSALTFMYLTLLLLPSLLLIILPIAFFFGALFTLNRLSGDSELVVMASAGYSLRQLSVPLLLAAAIVMALTCACALYFVPASQRALNAKKLDIRADIGAALLNEGEFNDSTKGLTVFIRRLDNNGQISGILVHDSREPARPSTYIATRGILAQTPAGARLIMFDGTIEQSGKGGAQLSVLHFRRDTIDLDQFASRARTTLRGANERYLGELLWPQEKEGLTPRIRRAWVAEAHNRLSQPLYCLAFAMIAMAAVMRGRRQRGALAMRLTLASLAAAGVRIAGYGVQGLAQNQPDFIAVFYLIPLLGAAGALAVLMGFDVTALLRKPQSAGASA